LPPFPWKKLHANAINAGRLTLALNDLRLPTIKII
jgi:hypothetical protein